MIKTKVLADTTYMGKRLTTMELEYPRIIHSELKTHRMFSSNSSSSRAIPLAKYIDIVNSYEYLPKWTLNQKGMQGNSNIDSKTINSASSLWLETKEVVINYCLKLQGLGIHKQHINRLLEPFSPIKTILTGTDEAFKHFFGLRLDSAVQPEMYELAKAMKLAYDNSEPEEDNLHLPYGKLHSDLGVNCLYNAAACAQISYRNLDLSEDKLKNIVYKLINSGKLHASAFEHIAVFGDTNKGNFSNYCQLRHIVENYLRSDEEFKDAIPLETFVKDSIEHYRQLF